MKKILALILLFGLFCSPCFGGGVIGAGKTDAGGGRVGAATSSTVTGTGEYPTFSRTFHSEYDATASGDVSYIFLDIGTTASGTMDYQRVGIWDADGDLLASSSNCSKTLISGTLYRYTLSSTIAITSGTTYKLGHMSGEGSAQLFYVSGTGTIYADTTSFTTDTCPATAEDPISDNVDYGSGYSFTGKVKTWVTNDADDY